ncbi:MAG: hypothetical protein B7Z22_08030 [Hyphomonas sp. 32-62-5]|nr:MAG: hypothetical protein B7Z22_08030 [Hyphomonas sp. 32-62-5]
MAIERDEGMGVEDDALSPFLYPSLLPHIRVSKPSHGGTFVSEVLPSGRHIPHPCFDRMKGKRPSDETLDLFEWQPSN